MSVNSRVHVVVPAAGLGLRMGASLPKQYLPLIDRPILQWTLETLTSLNPANLMVAINAEDKWFRELPEIGHIKPVLGGQTRAQSVLNALNELDAPDDDWVLVHDAVRPCLRLESAQRLIEVALSDGMGAILAQPVTETLKRADGQRIQATVDRNNLWRAQTPQIFPFAALREALAGNLEATDEASAMEALGHSVKLVPGDHDNIKITTKSDLDFAAFVLSQEHR